MSQRPLPHERRAAVREQARRRLNALVAYTLHGDGCDLPTLAAELQALAFQIGTARAEMRPAEEREARMRSALAGSEAR